MRFTAPSVLAALTFLGVVACEDETAIAPGVETFVATLSSGNEVPDTVTISASGSASFALIENVLSWKVDGVTVDNLTAGHIHAGGQADAGGVMVPLPLDDTGPGTVSVGSAEVVDSVITRMRNGTAYVNLHTAQQPGGVMRGQIRRP